MNLTVLAKRLAEYNSPHWRWPANKLKIKELRKYKPRQRFAPDTWEARDDDYDYGRILYFYNRLCKDPKIELDPIDVELAYTGDQFSIANGWHRMVAYSLAKRKTIRIRLNGADKDHPVMQYLLGKRKTKPWLDRIK